MFPSRKVVIVSGYSYSCAGLRSIVVIIIMIVVIIKMVGIVIIIVGRGRDGGRCGGREGGEREEEEAGNASGFLRILDDS